MKHTSNFIILLLNIVFMSSLSSTTNAQVFGTPIIEWTFFSGIPENWVNESADGISQWEYRGPNTTPSNAIASRGSCGAGSVVLNSETLADGFLIFDSNYWDDDGGACGGNIGGGPAPGPHYASLTTNSFSLENNPEATLTFQQQYRHYFSQGQSTVTRVLISVNGGDFELLQDNSADGITNSPNVEWVSLALTGIAGGESDVRLRFEFDGFYYWWMIDNITIFEPSDNDLVLYSANYSTFEQNLLNNYADQEYHFYPLNMLPQMEFRARGQNIGGLVQTNTKLSVEVNRGITNVFSNDSPEEDLQPGQSNNWQLAPWTPPAVTGDYVIDFALQQDQEDQTIGNNFASKDFTITEHSLGIDEGQMEDQFMPNVGYTNSAYRIGNVYVVDQNNLRLHDISVAFGDSSFVGTSVRASVYYFNNDSIQYGTSEDYVINSFDLNGVGENFMVHIPLIEPVTLIPDTNYFVTVECSTNPGERMIVARSGDAIPFTSFVNYELNNFGGYMLKYPMVRMNLYTGNELPGCTDPLAFNYDAEANTDDGSCRFAGCTDPNNDNYNPAANWEDGSCFIIGCMDPIADNYNAEALQEGDCIYLGCTDELADNFDPQANQDDGTCFIEGCMDENADNYNPLADLSGPCVYFGCTNPEAVNYDISANTDDGTCFFSEASFSVNTTTVCIPDELIINNQTTIDPEATCEWFINGELVENECVDSFTYNLTEPGIVDISYSYTLYGFETTFEVNNIQFTAIPETADLNYDDLNYQLTCANCDQTNTLQWLLNGEEIEVDGENIMLNQSGLYSLIQINPAGCESSPASIEINLPQGCTDSNAVNYNESAIEDDGTCFFESAFFDLNSNDVCVGEDLIATAAPSIHPDAICAWYLNGELLSEECTPQITINFPFLGSYAIEYTYTLFGFETSFTVDEINVLNVPDEPVVLFDDITGTLFCQDCGSFDFQWYLEGELIPEADGSVYAPLVDGLYSLELLNDVGCSTLSNEIDVIINNIEENEFDGRLFPNPSNASTHVINNQVIERAFVLDAQGKVLLNMEVKARQFTLDTRNLESGMYFVTLQSAGQIKKVKLLVSH